jgi:luciferase family oxidoreductase group 1
MRLSILDQSPVRKGGTARQALAETVALAQLGEKLGYTRFWVSEHHNTTSLAGSTPEVLIAHLANQTRHIKLGSGGIMLPHYSALKVAENFRMLEALFPGRIDLGIGRAPGGDRITASVLNPNNTFNEQEFVQQLFDLQSFLNDEHEPGTVFEKVRAIPVSLSVPDLWILSSSGQSGLFGAHFGMAFSFAHFINPIGGPKAVQVYKESFKPNEQLQAPQANVGVFVLCAETEEKVHELQFVMDVQLLRLERGLSKGFPPYEDVKDLEFSEAEWAKIRYNRNRIIAGTPDTVKAQLTDLAAEYGVDEIVVVTITHDFADRVRSYELLAEAFDLHSDAVLESGAQY